LTGNIESGGKALQKRADLEIKRFNRFHGSNISSPLNIFKALHGHHSLSGFFLGLPLPGTLRMASRALSSYRNLLAPADTGQRAAYQPNSLLVGAERGW
jgi:hypothetical protein